MYNCIYIIKKPSYLDNIKEGYFAKKLFNMSQLEFYSHEENDETVDNGPRTSAVLIFSVDISDSFMKELTQNTLGAIYCNLKYNLE